MSADATLPQVRQLSRGALIALVVGSMVGAGIFTLPAAFARTTDAVNTGLKPSGPAVTSSFSAPSLIPTLTEPLSLGTS